MEKEIKFEFEKETKGTFRFKEVSDAPIIGTLYIKKTFMKEQPKELTIILKVI